MKFQLRTWRLDDAFSIAVYANNEKIAANLRDIFPYPYSKEDAHAYIAGVLAADDTKQLVFAIDVQGEAVGSIGIALGNDIHCKTAEIGFWLGEPFWHKGIITQSIREMTAIAFQTYGIVRIYAEVFAHNTPSRKALERAGFTLEGILKNSICKQGKIFDSCIYALVKANT